MSWQGAFGYGSVPEGQLGSWMECSSCFREAFLVIDPDGALL